jgi:hypothetical protein
MAAMFCSTNYLTKSEFRRAVQQGAPVVLYSPILETPAINGPSHVCGPWEKDSLRIQKGWHAEVFVKDMRVVVVN